MLPRLLAALLPALCLLQPAAAADTAAPKPSLVKIYQTSGPGGPFGLWGSDVFAEQKVASRFTVEGSGDLQLARIGLHLFNNSDTVKGTVRLSLQTDALDEGGSETLPSGTELESWSFPTPSLGWNPVQQFVTSIYGPALRAGKHYWVVAESAAPAQENPVWAFASSGTQFSTRTLNGAWQTAGSGAAQTMRVEGTPLGSGRLPEVYLSIAASQIRSGERTLMSWDTRRAARCFAGGDWSGQYPTEDSVYVSPVTPGLYNFHLTCTNGSGRGGATVQLNVLPAN